MSEANCVACRFWESKLLESVAARGDYQHTPKILSDMGLCRLNGPKPWPDGKHSHPRHPRACWPMTSERDWCGEFQPKQPPAESRPEREGR